jgi:hypothetical protein
VYDEGRTAAMVVVMVVIPVVVPMVVMVIVVVVMMLVDHYARDRDDDFGGKGRDPEKKESQKNRAHEFFHR